MPTRGAQQVEILLRRQDVLAVEQHLAVGALVRIEVVHAVEHAQQRRLAAARRADEGGDLAVVERQGDVLQRLVVAVEEIEVRGSRSSRPEPVGSPAAWLTVGTVTDADACS